MASPTFGVALLTDLLTARSACCGVSMALALLLALSGSNWSLCKMSAVLIRVPELTTVARICRVCGTAVVTVPTFQTPVEAAYVPWLGVENRKDSPAGSTSCTLTLVALSGPLSVSVTVKVMMSPTLGVGLSTVLLRARSASWGVSVALALVLALTGANWSAWPMFAVLVCALGLTTWALICKV